ncbi:MAG: tetratricopeptide repeat protein [Acidobacteria bacterium]|nr:tetratricopeptide repeat protein [Acidobacteriota bacterium]
MLPTHPRLLPLLSVMLVLLTGHGDRAAVTASLLGVSQDAAGAATLSRETLEKLELVIAKSYHDPGFDRTALLHLLLNVAGGFNRLGEFDKAEKYGREALGIARKQKLRLQEATALNRLGLVHRGRGDHREALENFEGALAIIESLEKADQDVAHHRVPLLNNLALLQMEFGRHAAAADNFKKAAALARELLPKAQGQRGVVLKEDLARVLLNGANALDSLGETTLALDAAMEARQTSQEIQDRIGEADVLHFLGYVRNRRGEYAGAEPVLKEALQIQRELGDRTGQASALASLGFAYSRTDRLAESERMYRDALKLEPRGGRSSLATRLNLATVLVAQGRPAEADIVYIDTV